MKRNKGVSLLERVFDKILVLVFLLAFLAVLGWQLTTGPGEVVVAGRDRMPIDRAYQRVIDQASGLGVRLEEAAADPQAPPPPAPVADLLAQSIREELSHREDLPVPLSVAVAPAAGGGSTLAEVETEGLENPAFGLPSLPGPTTALASVVAGAMDPFEPLLHPAIAAAGFLPKQQPYDFRATTIQATFNPAQLLEAIELDPDGPDGPLRAAPGNWWRARLAVLDVQVQRQRVDDAGRPVGEPLLTAPAPGRVSLRDAVASVSDSGGLDALVQQALDKSKGILQPAFYNIIAGGPWRLPSEAMELAADRKKVQQLLRRLQSVEQELASLVQAAAQPGGGIGGGGGGGAQRPSRESNAKQREQERQKQAEEAKRKRIEALRAQRNDIVAQLKELGYDEEGQPLASQTLAALQAPPPDIVDPTEFTFWAFDVFLEPGARYRYRVRLTLANPLYGREKALAESARSFAASPVVHTQWSPWTEPVDVDRDAYLFVTRAASAGTIGGEASATVELYRFFYGGWRQVSRRVAAGDAVSAVVDLQEVAAGELPRFDVALVSDGVPEVRARTPITAPLTFDLQGAFVLQVAPAPTTGRASEQALEVVLRTPGTTDVEAHDPRAASRSALRRRLQEAAEQARAAVVLEPGSTPTERSRRDAATESKPDGAAPSSGGSGGLGG